MENETDIHSGSRSVKRKRLLRGLLAERDFFRWEDWAKKQRDPLRILLSLLFDEDALIRWRSIEALGRVAPLEAEKNLERVRVAIRRILWLMNDESGGICWKGPEAIGEILHSTPDLIKEYGVILPSFFTEEPFEGGSRWAVARAAPMNRQVFEYARPSLLDSLQHEDADIRGYSLMALKALNVSIPPETLLSLDKDSSIVMIYDFTLGQLQEKPISQLAAHPV